MNTRYKSYKSSFIGRKQRREPIFLFSIHNLHIKYNTTSMQKIMELRMKTLEQYGKTPDQTLTKDESEAAELLDYIDALLRTYRVRAQLPYFKESYADSLNTDWKPVWDKSTPINYRDIEKMLTNFCTNIEMCMVLVKDLKDLYLSNFVLAWKSDLMKEMNKQYQLYNYMRTNLLFERVDKEI